MANQLPDDVKKRAPAKCADRPHLEIQDPCTVWISPGRWAIYPEEYRKLQDWSRDSPEGNLLRKIFGMDEVE
jgi:hypothetical protein